MIVDIHQLPIPEWHLRCPKCGYLLNGLPSHRCAECGDSLDMDAIIPTWARLREPRFTGEELPLPDFGLYCNNCDAPLAGARQRECPSCHEPFEPMRSRPTKAWFVADTMIDEKIAPQLIAMMLEREFVPYVLEETQNPVTGSLSWSLRIMSDFYFEFLWLLRCRLHEMEDVTTLSDWQCQSCDNENPASFETCWHCGTLRS